MRNYRFERDLESGSCKSSPALKGAAVSKPQRAISALLMNRLSYQSDLMREPWSGTLGRWLPNEYADRWLPVGAGVTMSAGYTLGGSRAVGHRIGYAHHLHGVRPTLKQLRRRPRPVVCE